MPTLTVYSAAAGTPDGIINGEVQTSFAGHMWYAITNDAGIRASMLRFRRTLSVSSSADVYT